MEPIWFDAIIAGILLFTTIRGAMKGLVWQLAWIAAIVVCFAFSETVSLTVAEWIPVERPLNRWIAMLALYLVAAVACFGVAHKLRDWIEKARFQDVDRHFGALLGFLKGAIFALVLTFFAVTLSKAARQAALQSHSGYAAAFVMAKLHPVMPAELHDILHPYIHHLDGAEPKGVQLADDDGGGSAAGSSDSEADPSSESPPRQGGAASPKSSASSASAVARRRLLNRIAEFYTQFPEERRWFVEQTTGRLTGVPDDVALDVLHDWMADLQLEAPDPEPRTDIETSLASRIQLHLRRRRDAAKSARESAGQSDRR